MNLTFPGILTPVSYASLDRARSVETRLRFGGSLIENDPDIAVTLSRDPISQAQYLDYLDRYRETPWVVLAAVQRRELGLIDRLELIGRTESEEAARPAVRHWAGDYFDLMNPFPVLGRRVFAPPEIFTFRIEDRGFARSGDPAVNITWFEASAYCMAYGGRLPTNLEWQAGLIQDELLNSWIRMEWVHDEFSWRGDHVALMEQGLWFAAGGWPGPVTRALSSYQTGTWRGLPVRALLEAEPLYRFPDASFPDVGFRLALPSDGSDDD